MNSIFVLILSIVMTWTVQSKSLVTGEGQWPYDIEVDYSCSYQKGDVREGDTAVLRLGNLGGITLDSIQVWVRSNKDQGAGEFTVTGNGQVIATKSGTFKDWTGSYDKDNFHPISLLTAKEDGINELVITLLGTTNSLHIEKYVITYEAAPPHTVTLMQANRVFDVMTESQGMGGIVLPSVSDTAEWKFIGWSEVEIWESHEEPTLHPAGKKFYPLRDCTLWAAYRYSEEPEMVYVDDLQSGMYQYVNRESEMALVGVPVEGRMTAAPISDDPDQVYYFEFVGTDTAFITHLATETPIGYSGTQVSAKATPWLVYHEGEETLFYTLINSVSYILWLNVYDSGSQSFYAGLLKAEPASSPMALQVPQTEGYETLITCHPESPQGLEEVIGDGLQMTGPCVLMRFGNYELILNEGKKYLQSK